MDKASSLALCGSCCLGANEFVPLHKYTVLVSLRLRTLHPSTFCPDFNHHLACLLDFCSQSSSYCLRSMFSWNLTSLILQAGDIELNPGPCPIDPNPVICAICSKKINRGSNLEAAVSCSSESCDAQLQVCLSMCVLLLDTRH